MATTALVLSILALLIALSSRSGTATLASKITDVEADGRRRGENLLNEVDSRLGVVQRLLARVHVGDKNLNEQMITDGQLWADIPVLEAERLLEQEGTRAIDVRTAQEVESGMIPSALHIPVDELEQRIMEIPRDGQPTILVCAVGGRSAAACEFLSRQGFEGLFNLTGGMGAWKGPTERPS